MDPDVHRRMRHGMVKTFVCRRMSKSVYCILILPCDTCGANLTKRKRSIFSNRALTSIIADGTCATGIWKDGRRK